MTDGHRLRVVLGSDPLQKEQAGFTPEEAGHPVCSCKVLLAQMLL